MKGATSGQTSFDVIRLKTDDSAFHTLLASAQADEAVAGGGSTLTAENLNTIVDTAIGQLTDAYALDAGQVALLDAVNFQIADLGGLILGDTIGTTVLIDTDAAGYGWFIDTTPADNKEFKANSINGELTAMASTPAFGDMDLLTVVMHELGHVLGFTDLNSAAGEDSLMGATLEVGTRYLPGNNGNGTSKAPAPQYRSEEAPSSLVNMDTRAAELLAGASSPAALKQNSWLASYLVNGAENGSNSFGVNDGIQILLDPKDKKNNKGISKGL
jgi:hypothetical protein